MENHEYSSIYPKTVNQKNEYLEFFQQFYNQFSWNLQEFTNLVPLKERTFKNVQITSYFKNGLIWVIKKLNILDFFQGF